MHEQALPQDPGTDGTASSGAAGRGSALRTLLLGAVVAVAVIAGVLLAAPGRQGPLGGGAVQAPAAGQAPAGGSGLSGATLQASAQPMAPEPLPEATLAGFDGGPDITMSSYRGQPLVVNFWATWCAPCVAEMPDLQAVAEQLRGEVAFLGINHSDAPSNAVTFVQDLGITYDLATDADGSYLEEQIRGFGMPTTLLVDPGGTIVHRHTGPVDAEELRTLLAEHLGVRRAGSTR